MTTTDGSAAISYLLCKYTRANRWRLVDGYLRTLLQGTSFSPAHQSAGIVLSFSESCLLKNFAERGATEKSAVIVLSFSESCLLNEVRRKKASVAETRGGGEAAMPAAGVLTAGAKEPHQSILI